MFAISLLKICLEKKWEHTFRPTVNVVTELPFEKINDVSRHTNKPAQTSNKP